ncbi:MAG TPA: hypothetical protein VEK38_02445 [Candidatus Bathyarchaeia archaeon]|nr:hypothetical protein [Candidatus Bathyarchaeia archaeon]
MKKFLLVIIFFGAGITSGSQQSIEDKQQEVLTELRQDPAIQQCLGTAIGCWGTNNAGDSYSCMHNLWTKKVDITFERRKKPCEDSYSVEVVPGIDIRCYTNKDLNWRQAFKAMVGIPLTALLYDNGFAMLALAGAGFTAAHLWAIRNKEREKSRYFTRISITADAAKQFLQP